jgi:hypothetical protein
MELSEVRKTSEFSSRALRGEITIQSFWSEGVEQISPIDDCDFFDLLMPNRLRAQQMRIVGWFMLFWTVAIGIYVVKVIGFDLYVRTHWQMVDGAVIKYEEKSAQLGSIRSRRLTYWLEFEVEFDPKNWGCNTGMSWAVPMPSPCIGKVLSPGSRSMDVARGWGYRHPVNSAAKFYYDPATGRLRFARESILDLYPWIAIAAFALGTGISSTLLYTSRDRLKQLDTTPPDGAIVGAYADNPTRGDELTDLKLP